MKNSTTHKKHGRRRPAQPTSAKPNSPIGGGEAVQLSNDKHIDQDFPGFPHHPSREDEIHNGSAGAFDATEAVRDDEDD